MPNPVMAWEMDPRRILAPPLPSSLVTVLNEDQTSAVQHVDQNFRNPGTNLFHLEISFSFY